MKERMHSRRLSNTSLRVQLMFVLLALSLLWWYRSLFSITQSPSKTEQLPSQMEPIACKTERNALLAETQSKESIQRMKRLSQILCPDGVCSAMALERLGMTASLHDPHHYHLFVHIPKTGGASVREFFRGLCQKHNISMGVTLNASRKLASPFFRTKSRFKLQAVFGHFAYGMHRMLSSPAVYSYYASFRDPVERWMSHFVWAKKRRYAYMKPHNLTSWVDANYDCNLQFTVLAGLAPNDFSLQNKLHQSWAVPCGNYDHHHYEMVERIKQKIDTEFRFVVLQSRFTQSLALLCDHFGVSDEGCTKIMSQNNDQIHVTHSSSRLKELTEEQLNKAKEQNHLDILIHEHLIRRFEVQWADYKARNPDSKFAKLP